MSRRAARRRKRSTATSEVRIAPPGNQYPSSNLGHRARDTFRVTGSPLTETVIKDTTAAADSSSANPSVFGQSVTFTATVTPNSGSATPTGSVTFKDGSTTLATVPLNSSGVATFTTAALAMGTHPINAIYQANVPFVASFANVSQVVNAASGTAVPMLDARALALLALALAAAGLFFARGSYSPT